MIKTMTTQVIGEVKGANQRKPPRKTKVTAQSVIQVFSIDCGKTES